jgi:post-segregation antitoxin (ccd killing protein)
VRDVNKKSVMVYLDPEVVKEARELGLNISRICENALREAIRRLKGENCGINEKIVLRPGFEPGSGAREAS